MFIWSRLVLFLSNVFLYLKEEVVFEELYIDKNDHYRETVPSWSLDGAYVALTYDETLKRELAAYKYLGRKEKKDVFMLYLEKCFDLFLSECLDDASIIAESPLFFSLGSGGDTISPHSSLTLSLNPGVSGIWTFFEKRNGLDIELDSIVGSVSRIFLELSLSGKNTWKR